MANPRDTEVQTGQNSGGIINPNEDFVGRDIAGRGTAEAGIAGRGNMGDMSMRSEITVNPEIQMGGMTSLEAYNAQRNIVLAAIETLKSEVKRAENKYKVEMKITPNAGGNVEKLQMERGGIRKVMEMIRNKITYVRAELDKLQVLVDTLPEDKRSSEDAREWLKKAESNYDEAYVKTWTLTDKLWLRDRSLRDMLQSEGEEEVEPIDFMLNKGININQYKRESRSTNNRRDPNYTMTKALTKNNYLDLPKFSGKMVDWLGFWEMFKILIHDTDEPDIIKFSALKNACEGKALELIKRYPSDGSAYEEAVNRLMTIYNSDQGQFKHLYEKLKAIKRSRESLQDCRRIFNEVAIIANQLKRLGISVDTPTYLTEIRYKFPRNLLEEVARVEREKYGGRIAVMKDLLDEIENYILTHEDIENEYGNEELERSFQAVRIEKPGCAFCNKQGHHASECRRVTNPSDRRREVMNLKLCFNCFGRNHEAKDCKKPSCQKCKRRHHVSICNENNMNRSDQRSRNNHSRERYNNNNNNNTRSRSNSRDRYNQRSNSRERQNQRGDSRDRGDQRRNFRERSRSLDRERNARQSNYNGNRSRNANNRSRSTSRGRKRDSTPYGKRVEFANQNMVRSSANRLISGEFPIYKNEFEENERVIDILFDNGSDSTFIDKRLASEMNLEIVEQDIRMSVNNFGGGTREESCDRVLLFLKLEDSKYKRSRYLGILAYAYDGISRAVAHPELESQDIQFTKENGIKLRPKENPIEEPKLLIGLDLYYSLIDERKGIERLPSGLRVVKTKLCDYWVVFGRPNKSLSNVYTVRTDEEIVDKLTELEGIGILERDESADEIVENFKRTVRISNNGEICVRWPWKDGKREQLTDNKPLAFSRFMNFVNSPKTKKYWDEIVRQMDEQEANGIIEEVKNDEPGTVLFYIPYQTVTNESSNTTKVRIVYDASAKLRGKLSLNEAIYQGPTLIPDLLGILLRVRCAKNILLSDVAKAFLQIRLNEEDQDTTRFYWVKDPQKAVNERFCPEEGEIVLIKGDNEPKENWKLGKVEKLIRSRDGKIRTVELRICNNDPRRKTTGSKILTRTINHLVPLGVKSSKQEIEEKKLVVEEKEEKEEEKIRNEKQKRRKDESPQRRYNTRLAAKREREQTVQVNTVRTMRRPILTESRNWLYYLLIFMMIISTTMGQITGEIKESNMKLNTTEIIKYDDSRTPHEESRLIQTYEMADNDKENATALEKGKRKDTNSKDSIEAEILCVENGVQLKDPKYVENTTYRVCSENFCVNPIPATHSIEVDFPADITSQWHRVSWRKMEEKSKQYRLIETKCPPKDYCGAIRCRFCLETLLNPHCHPWMFIVTITTMLILIILPILIKRYWRNLQLMAGMIWHSEAMRGARFICYVIAGFIVYIMTGIRDVIRWCIRERRERKVHRQRKREGRQGTELLERRSKSTSIIRRVNQKKERINRWTRRSSANSTRSRSDEREMRRNPSVTSISSRKTVRFRSESPSGRSVKSVGSWKPYKYGNLIVIFCLIVGGDCCDRIIPITHTEKTCTEKKCIVETEIDIFTSPLEKVICITAATNDRILTKISIEMEYQYRVCEKFTSSYTYNTSIEVAYKKKCYKNGLCKSERCNNVNADTKIEEFGKTNEIPGITYCVTSDGGWIEGCWSFKDACLFYRTGARRNNEKRFEIFECDSWTNGIAFAMTVESGNKEGNTTEPLKYLMYEGEKEKIINSSGQVIGNIEVITIEEPVAIKPMSGKFIREGKNLGTVIDGNGLKVPLICDEKDNCKYEERCECLIGASEPNCRCEEHDLFKLTKDEGLPLISQHFHIVKVEKDMPAIKFFHPRVHIQIQLATKYEISEEYSNATCEITDYTQVKGCYNCLKTAGFDVTCRSKERSSALITCNNRNFLDRLSCGKDGVANHLRKRFNTSLVKETCIISCGKKKKVIELTGVLHYEVPETMKDVFFGTKGETDQSVEVNTHWPDWAVHIGLFIESIVEIVGTVVSLAVIAWIMLNYVIPCVAKLVR